MKRLGIGIIGLGGAGSWGHFPGYLEIPDKAKVVALCDTNPDAMKDKIALAEARAYSDYSQLLKDPEVDAVDICLPHFLHARVAVDAAEAGKHVMVEKPFTLTTEEADVVIAAVKKCKVKLMVAENTRFVNAYESAFELIPSLGKISFVRTFIGGNGISTRMNNQSWRHHSETAGGGSLFDGAVHSHSI